MGAAEAMGRRTKAQKGRRVMRRLEIGPGPEKLGDDWTTVSVAPAPSVDALCEWGIDRLPFDDRTFDEVYASHVIEHVPWTHHEPALMEAWRVLKPGGMIELHTLDFAEIVNGYITGEGVPTDPGAGWKHPLLFIMYRVFAYPHTVGSRADPNWHRSLFDADYLEWLLARSGFERIEFGGEPRGAEKHGKWNIGVRAWKR